MSKNPFLDLGFPPEEAATLHIRSQLAATLELHISVKVDPVLRRVNSRSRSRQSARSLTETLRSFQSNSS